MIRFLARRVAVCAATILAASFITFASLYIAPGDPISFLVGGRPTTPEARQALAAQYHLDEPFLQRYWTWLTDALHGDFGQSIQLRQDVGDLIASRLGTTILLVTLTFVVVLVVGIGVGAFAALKPGKKTDDVILVLMSISIATPAFIAAVALISVFAVQLGWFPVFGQGSGLADRLHHLALPAIALAIGWWPVIGQTARSSLRAELASEHVETARSRGLPRRQVFRKHVLRNALIPITTISGLAFAGLIAGTAIVESAFQLSGIGGLLISSVSSRDFPVAQAVALILVVVFAVTNLAVDIAYGLLDPRVRETWSAS